MPPLVFCPICAVPVPNDLDGELVRVDCPRCGSYKISGSAAAATAWATGQTDENIRRAKVSYALRRMQIGGKIPELDTKLRERIIDETQLPTPTELVTNLLLLLGDELCETPDKSYRVSGTDILGLVARIGGVGNDKGIAFYAIQQLEQLGLVDPDNAMTVAGAKLTFNGWQEYDKLKHEIVESRRAFMAMPFNNLKLDNIYKTCFRPAVAATGFQLYRIDEKPPAGSIDNRLRVEIRRSRFLIADLTEDNSGSYWEAGFAEGLDRPVIYTCEKGQPTHFDTRQQQTIFWTEDKLDEAAQRLKDTIRATLPSEAVLDDNE